MSKKICLLTDSLGSGGAERMVSNLSISLSKRGCQIYIVSMIDSIIYPYSGELYNFGEIKKNSNRLSSFLKFRKFFKEQKFDIIIDHRIRPNFIKEFIFSKTVFNNHQLIYCVHHFELSLYFPCIHFPWLSKFSLVRNRKIIAVSKAIQNEIEKDLRLSSEVIYNYVLVDESKKSNYINALSATEYIIGVGRLTKSKQFDVLIKGYNSSDLPKNNIKLLILGDGVERENLNQLINDLNLNAFVELIGFKKNAFEYIEKAKALVLTSKSEGFPMVLIEALTLKTPIVSFDCKSGPSEIIEHNKNGLLVENQNLQELTKSLNKLLLDDVFYEKIKENFNKSNHSFTEEIAIQNWMKIIKDIY
jgi:glycosyltransferase involved in cell wall biosynthesis